jgi:hypothetical protein
METSFVLFNSTSVLLIASIIFPECSDSSHIVGFIVLLMLNEVLDLSLLVGNSLQPPFAWRQTADQ